MILILDFGSQYTQLIARRIRELNVYCEIHPYNYTPGSFSGIKGIIFSGSPFSVHDKDAPRPEFSFKDLPVPLLGVCYGAQIFAHDEGGKVQASNTREYGRANLSYVDNSERLMNGIENHSQVWMSHGDSITLLPAEYRIIARTNDVGIAAFRSDQRQIYGLQFHPEVYHSKQGTGLLKNFLVEICGCSQQWTPESFIQSTIKQLREKIKTDKVVLGLSGGVDSSVAGVLLHKAIGSQLHCIFVDNGLLRKNEFEQVLDSYRDMGLNVKGVRSESRFLKALKGISDPEEKRKAIGRTFIEVFDEEANKIKNVVWLAQGTIYPDVIESASVKGPSATIKSHHNVGGLPEYMKLKIVEPLNSLFKDEVRRIGLALGISQSLLQRHPFPGPGLGVRILGEVTAEKVAVLQEADNIFISALRSEGLYNMAWQAFAVLLPVQTVGVMGDERTYENVIALRAVDSTDGMTADWVHLPFEFLAKVSNQIINQVKGINRVVYDISSKPPATIEWE
ncbi:MAG TPA: glutamine-hydrolyzing GMP synthase [Bacteroidales bacterium]|nr:glutamine-hydrolyzing GMP synthase [Bacteroidales bacterium]